jgi:hypothetical protein
MLQMMSTVFADVKPFPTPNPNTGMGGNNPPLEEQILLEFDEALRANEGLIDRIAQMEAKAKALDDCPDQDAANRLTDFIKLTKVAAAAVEEERERLNRPMLNAQRALMARANSYKSRAEIAGKMVNVHLSRFMKERDDLKRAEAARVAEEYRLREAARQAEIDAANAKAAAVAEAERKRLQAIEDERAAQEKRDAYVVEVEPEKVFVPEPVPVFTPVAIDRGIIRGDYGTTAFVAETWNVKVEKVWEVPRHYLSHPTVAEAVEKVIRPLVRGKNGLREIKGCSITPTRSTVIR